MKKLIFGITALALLSTISCKKDKGGVMNSWTVGSKTYTAKSVAAIDGTFIYDLVAHDGDSSNPHSIIFFFNGSGNSGNTRPTAGTYKVVNTANPAPGQLGFAASGPSPEAHYSLGNDKVNASVTLIDNKIHISMPKAWASGMGDSVQVSAEITEL